METKNETDQIDDIHTIFTKIDGLDISNPMNHEKFVNLLRGGLAFQNSAAATIKAKIKEDQELVLDAKSNENMKKIFSDPNGYLPIQMYKQQEGIARSYKNLVDELVLKLKLLNMTTKKYNDAFVTNLDLKTQSQVMENMNKVQIQWFERTEQLVNFFVDRTRDYANTTNDVLKEVIKCTNLQIPAMKTPTQDEIKNLIKKPVDEKPSQILDDQPSLFDEDDNFLNQDLDIESAIQKEDKKENGKNSESSNISNNGVGQNDSEESFNP